MDIRYSQHILVCIVVVFPDIQVRMSIQLVRHYYDNYCAVRMVMVSMDFHLVAVAVLEFRGIDRMDHRLNLVDMYTLECDSTHGKWLSWRKFHHMDRHTCIWYKPNVRYNLRWFHIHDGILCSDRMDFHRSLANNNMHRLHFVHGIQHWNHMVMDYMVLRLVLTVLFIK